MNIKLSLVGRGVYNGAVIYRVANWQTTKTAAHTTAQLYALVNNAGVSDITIIISGTDETVMEHIATLDQGVKSTYVAFTTVTVGAVTYLVLTSTAAVNAGYVVTPFVYPNAIVDGSPVGMPKSTLQTIQRIHAEDIAFTL